jgi:two-component system, NarL family, response regulator LiaR
MGQKQTIRILIVDDHLVVREGLAALLEPYDDLLVIGEAETGTEGVRICCELQPDVVLMDLVMPEMDGIEATRAIRRECRRSQILALTSFIDDRLVRGVLEAGAVGYLLKNVRAQQLADAVRAVSRGEFTIDPEANRVLVEAMRAPPPPPDLLTDREQEVLALLVLGHSNSVIGQQLGISPHTVKNHLRSIYGKLDVSTRTAAARLAMKHDLLENR